MSMVHVGFIGTGRMGEPMTGHILSAGFPVTVYDVNPVPLQRLAERGATVAANQAAAAQDADVVITMLPNDEALQTVGTALLPVLQPGQTLVDTSTSRLNTSLRLRDALGQRDVAMLDAPVTGGETGAQAGTLNIMVGGERDVFDRCVPVLQATARRVVYIGGPGHGLIAKYVNQMIMQATFAGVAEAFTLAETLGADKTAIYEAIHDGAAASFVLNWAAPGLLRDEWGSGRELTLHAKDGAYALAAAEDAHAFTPVTALSHELFKLALFQGEGERQPGALARVFQRAHRR